MKKYKFREDDEVYIDPRKINSIHRKYEWLPEGITTGRVLEDQKTDMIHVDVFVGYHTNTYTGATIEKYKIGRFYYKEVQYRGTKNIVSVINLLEELEDKIK